MKIPGHPSASSFFDTLRLDLVARLVEGGRASLVAGAASSMLLFSTGCAGLQLTTIKATQQRPSNVAVYFKVQNNQGEPIADLKAESFRIYEDDQLVSQFESKQTILNPEVAAVHYTLLLVDMSGSVSESGTGDTLVSAVGAFTDRVEKDQKVGIYAFDGSPDLTPIVPFTDQQGSAKAGVQQLATFKPKDPSTNLNGAVVRALDELDIALGKANQPLKFGTVVVFTDGTDRANRVPAAEMEQHIKEKPFDVFAIGLGAEMQQDQLSRIGKSGTAMAADKSAITKAFDEVGAKVDARTKSFYLLSYCSPSRAGKHEVRVEAVVKNANETEQTGSLTDEFDATGFAPGCDPNTPPSFDVTKGDALAPPPPPDTDKDKKIEVKARASVKAGSPPPPHLPPPPPPKPAAAPAPAPAPAQDFNP
ncbi:MAG TPA: VWA domain-containing protein [Polyangiaceae bacterium]|nr:VWA domain-containing protein [Polyangiaceae bacterium]